MNREASSPSKSSNHGSIPFNSPSSQSNHNMMNLNRISSSKNRTLKMQDGVMPFKQRAGDLKDVVIQGTASIKSARGSQSPKSGSLSPKKTPKYHKGGDIQIAISKDNTEGYQSSGDGGGSGRGSKLVFKPTMNSGNKLIPEHMDKMEIAPLDIMSNSKIKDSQKDKKKHSDPSTQKVSRMDM